MDDRSAPVTKGDLQDSVALLRSEMKEETALLRSEMKEETALLRSEMKEEAVQLRAEMKENTAQLRAEMGHHYNDLVERLHDVQTELLKAFYSYAQTNDKRMGMVENNQSGIQGRVATLEERMLEVEKRLNMPPAA